jgi:hypothetical protein
MNDTIADIAQARVVSLRVFTPKGRYRWTLGKCQEHQAEVGRAEERRERYREDDRHTQRDHRQP